MNEIIRGGTKGVIKNSIYLWSLESQSQLETVESIIKNAMANVGIEENRYQIYSIKTPYGNVPGLPALMVGLRVLSGPCPRSSIIKEMMRSLRQELKEDGSILGCDYNKCWYIRRE